MRWRRWLTRGRMSRAERERDVEREIRAHLELEAEDREAAGMSGEDARIAARRAFGNSVQIREEVRDMWRMPALETAVQGLRHAVRLLGRAPGFAAIAVGSTALGIGACSVIFAVVNFALLRPLPVDEPERLSSLFARDGRTGDISSVLSYPEVRDLRQVQAFEGVAAFDPLLAASIGWQGDPQRHWGALVTANYFAVVKPGF